MGTRDEAWAPGTPCWVDLVVDDTAMAKGFYGELFGWDCQDQPAAAGGYSMCLLQGHPTAGIGPKPEGLDMPAVWSTYLATDDADETAAEIRTGGGSLMMEPFDVLDVGRMAVGFDPSGAAFGIWQAKSHVGSQIVNEAGALTWNECMTPDYARSKEFYAGVFGYEYDELGDGENFSYSLIKVAGSGVGGLGELGAETPEEVPAHWMTYFGTTETDATVERAQSLGAKVQMAARDSEYGRLAVLAGPQGEVFSVIQVGEVGEASTGEAAGV